MDEAGMLQISFSGSCADLGRQGRTVVWAGSSDKEDDMRLVLLGHFVVHPNIPSMRLSSSPLPGSESGQPVKAKNPPRVGGQGGLIGRPLVCSHSDENAPLAIPPAGFRRMSGKRVPPFTTDNLAGPILHSVGCFVRPPPRIRNL